MKLAVGIIFGIAGIWVKIGLADEHPEMGLVFVLFFGLASVFTTIGLVEIFEKNEHEENLRQARAERESQNQKREVQGGQLPNLTKKLSGTTSAQLSDSGLALEMDKSGVLEGQDALQNIAGVYIVANDEDGRFKIGQTGNFEKRFSQLQKTAWAAGVRNIRPVCLFPMNEERESIERGAHLSLLRYRVSGEWFKCGEETAIRAVINAISERRGYGGIQEDIPF